MSTNFSKYLTSGMSGGSGFTTAQKNKKPGGGVIISKN